MLRSTLYTDTTWVRTRNLRIICPRWLRCHSQLTIKCNTEAVLSSSCRGQQHAYFSTKKKPVCTSGFMLTRFFPPHSPTCQSSFCPEPSSRHSGLSAEMSPKGSNKQQSEEDLLLQDFSRNLSAKSTALFYGNALIVSAIPICKYHRLQLVSWLS